MSDEAGVLAAADACIDAFGRHDRDAYFATFAPDATFIFYTAGTVLSSRAEWERVWDRLVAEDGFRVLACESRDRRVQMLGPDAAVFSHRVLTRSTSSEGELETDERETIIYHRQPDGSWLAVHEHLSPTPDGAAG